MQTSKQKNILRALAALAILLLVMPFWVFVINERELAVVLRFGKPVREYVEPGVHFKVPFVETVRRLPKTLQYWGDAGETIPDLPTRDDKKIELTPWAIWRINEPTSFVQRLRTEQVAEQRVRQITRSAIRDVISQYDLAELVRSTDRPIPKSSDYKTAAVAVEVAPLEDAIELPVDDVTQIEIQHGRPKLIAEIKAKAQERLSQQVGSDPGGRGIELLDVGISQIDFVESVRIKTFDRWIAERDSISARNTNEGERLKQGIINEAKAEVERIEGEGQQQASEIKGAADAKVITRYADAINTVGEFYTFQRTLEAYEKAIGQDSRMILTTDSQLLQLLKELPEREEAQ